MKVLIINASPKRKGGASRCFSRTLRLLLAGCEVQACEVRSAHDYEGALGKLSWADAVVISSPLYVDGIPSSLLPFLERAEKLCKTGECRFRLYVISNCGFVEGIQNATHLRMYEAWCARAGVQWGGGLGIGGGVILHVFSILLPIFALLGLIKVIIYAALGSPLGSGETWSAFGGALWMLFFLSGQLICEGILAWRIRALRQGRDIFIRPLMPSFVFLPMADLFMLVLAIFKGTLPHKMFKRYLQPPEGD